MHLVVNGTGREVEGAATIAALLAALGLPPGSVVVEHNGEVLARAGYAEVALGEGDRVEIVRFVGGG